MPKAIKPGQEILRVEQAVPSEVRKLKHEQVV